MNFLKITLASIALMCLSSVASAQVTQKVVSDGIGTSVESALQNAAERALMQVVGTYVDTETMISKRKEIKDGVKSQTKTISREMLQFSNGSIRKVDVLDVVEDGAFIRVEALVEVSINDVKGLMKPFIVAEAKVSKGLFAGIAKNKDQTKDRIKLITKRIIKPLLSGQNIEAQIWGVSPLNQQTELIPNWIYTKREIVPNYLPHVLSRLWIQSEGDIKRYFQNQENKFKQNLSDSNSLVVLGYETRLTTEFQEQIHTILKNASFKIQKFDTINTANNERMISDKSASTVNICTFELDYITCYSIDIGKAVDYGNNFDVNSYLTRQWNEKRDRELTYRTFIKLKDDLSNDVYENYITYLSAEKLEGVFNSATYNKRNRHLTSWREHNNYSAFYNFPGYQPKNTLFIPFISGDFVYMNVPDELLAKVSSLEIKIVESEEFVSQTANDKE